MALVPKHHQGIVVLPLSGWKNEKETREAELKPHHPLPLTSEKIHPAKDNDLEEKGGFRDALLMLGGRKRF